MDFLHGEAGAEGVDDGFTAAAGEVDFDRETEAFLGDEEGAKMRFFFENAKSAEIGIWVKLATFGETGIV